MPYLPCWPPACSSECCKPEDRAMLQALPHAVADVARAAVAFASPAARPSAIIALPNNLPLAQPAILPSCN
jgi:hypothetical protein